MPGPGDRLHRGLEAVTVLLLAAYFVLVILQVFFRYVLNRSLFWSEEVVRFALVWSVMLGSAVVAYRGEHLRIDALDTLLPPTAQRVLTRLAEFLTFVFCVILTGTGVQFTLRTLTQRSAVLEVPIWAVYAAVPVGAALEAACMLMGRRRGPPGPRTSEAAL
ncbi:MAG TPA: TRAP transporter small permease [Methylomirabilota bacterium]|jgi:TRAP-type C4-dicarboxylate transport system permease small subunit|nr:TRAP transporter small permease [Methylomirabilota bacterium]